MKKTDVTPQVLEMLLENWGLFVTSGNWGPKIATECGSAERAFNHVRGRYDRNRRDQSGDDEPISTAQCQDDLGERLERIIRELPIDYVNVLVRAYGYRRVIFGSYGKAILDSAKVSVHEKLEEQGYA
jgi:hypothetical protein